MSFTEFHTVGGWEFMSLLSVLFAIILAAAILNMIRVSRRAYNPEKQVLVIKDIKAIGVFAIVCGIFAQSIGLFMALEIIAQAPDISPSLLYDGIRVSSITTIYGTFIFLMSWLITIILTNWSRRVGQ